MAKSQSFADKVKKAQSDNVPSRAFRVVFSYKSAKKDSWKFLDKMVHIPEDQNEDQFIDEMVKEATEKAD